MPLFPTDLSLSSRFFYFRLFQEASAGPRSEHPLLKLAEDCKGVKERIAYLSGQALQSRVDPRRSHLERAYKGEIAVHRKRLLDLKRCILHYLFATKSLGLVPV